MWWDVNWHLQRHGSQSEKGGVPTPGLERVIALGGSILVSQGVVHKLEESGVGDQQTDWISVSSDVNSVSV